MKSDFKKIDKIFSEIRKIVIGQDYMIDRLLIGLFTQGHILLEGVPGLAKTLTVKTLSDVLKLDFNRIQFTPDLLPSDLIGTMIFNQKNSKFEVKKGPIFSNIILADEINRSPAKVQSALLESMQERQVTIGDVSYNLDNPFLVLATQNPIDQEGTYPLPEAQRDRFMMKINVNYPTKEEELEIMKRMSNLNFNHKVNRILTKKDILTIRSHINKVSISDSLEKYIISVVNATRNPEIIGLKNESDYINYGASPRASINMNLASKAIAFFNQRDYVLPDDIKNIAVDVLNHRIILNYEAEADGITTTQIINSILEKIEINSINANEFNSLYKAKPNKILLIDVRENEEFSTSAIEGSISIPLSHLNQESDLKFIQKESLNKEVFTICKSGKRSEKASRILSKFKIQSRSIEGGIEMVRKILCN